MNSRLTSIPSLVRIKPGALDRAGIYAKREGFRKACCFFSENFPPALSGRLFQSLESQGIQIADRFEVVSIEFAEVAGRVHGLSADVDVIIGFGGGKALDAAKYVAHLAALPFFSIPASLSHDGFSSSQSSLLVNGRRRSLPASMPFGVIVDTELCLHAPEILWLSGVGDMVSKITAVADWKLAFHAEGAPVDDFSVVLADASVQQFLSRPVRDLEGTRLLATALLLSGISMAVAGSSRPASGSEHLISHALDSMSRHPRLHGIQVGTATYLVSLLQQNHSTAIAKTLESTGFWNAIRSDPFDFREWMEACRLAPQIKPGYYTVLSSRDCIPEIADAIRTDPTLSGCFTGGFSETI